MLNPMSLLIVCASAFAAEIGGNGIIYALMTAEEKYADPRKRNGCFSKQRSLLNPTT